MKPNRKRVNPYTQIAALHNRGIDYVFRQLKDRQSYSEAIDFETILEIASEYMAKIQNDKSDAKKAMNYAELANLFNMDRDKVVDKMLEEKGIPMDVIGYLQRVRNLDENLYSDDLIKKITNIENELLDSDFSNDDIKFVLLYIAIAKGSIKDWQRNYNLRFPNNFEEKGWPWKEDADTAYQAALIVGPIDFFITGSVATVVSVVGGSVVASTWAAVKNKKNR